MKKLLLLSAAVIFVAFPISASAQGTVYINDNNQSSITGNIQDMGVDHIELIVDGQVVKVDTDDINLDEGMDKLLNPGDRIQVFGKFENGEFEASNIMKMGDTDANATVSVGK